MGHISAITLWTNKAKTCMTKRYGTVNVTSNNSSQNVRIQQRKMNLNIFSNKQINLP